MNYSILVRSRIADQVKVLWRLAVGITRPYLAE